MARWRLSAAVTVTSFSCLVSSAAATSDGSRHPPIPPRPRVDARLSGGYVYWRYCFGKPLAKLKVRPWRVYTTIDNLHDRLPPITFDWPVSRRCASLKQTVALLKPPYRLIFTVRSAIGIESPPLFFFVG